MTPQKPEVKVGVKAAVSIRQESIHIRQQMAFDVRHRDLSEITLFVPTSLYPPTVRLGDSEELLERLSVEGNDVTFALPSPVRDQFDLQIDYYWSPDSLSEESAELPLVLPASAEQELTEIVVGTNEPEFIRVKRAEGWGRVHSDEFIAAWLATERHDKVNLQLHHALRNTSDSVPRFLVLKSYVRGANLVTSMTGVYSRPVNSALFALPDGVIAEDGFVGGDQAVLDQVSAGEGERRTILVRSDSVESSDPSFTVTLFVQQPLNERSRLFSQWRPKLPEIVGMDADCNVIWMLGQTPTESMMYWGSRMTGIGNMNGGPLFSLGENNVNDAIASMLSPYQTDVVSSVKELVSTSSPTPGSNQILAGPLYRDAPILISVSRSMTLLVAAAIGLIVYFSFLRLSPVSLISSTAIAAAAVTAVVAVVPGPAQLILIRLIPGVVIALVAALLQRNFNRRPTTTPLSLNEFDHSTIFTVEKPAYSRDVPVVVMDSENVVSGTSSGLSVP